MATKKQTPTIPNDELIEVPHYTEIEEVDATTQEIQEARSEIINRQLVKRRRLQEIKAQARKDLLNTRIVSIMTLDPVEASSGLDTCYLSFTNTLLGGAGGISKYIPFNTPVELEQVLINVAKETTFVRHIVDPQTGNTTVTMSPKYQVTFHEDLEAANKGK